LGLFTFDISRAELQMAQTLAEQMLRLAQLDQDPAHLLQAHLAIGSFRFFTGEFVSAHSHLEQVILCDPQQSRSQTFRHGIDPEVICRSYASFVLWYLGYPDQALRNSRNALTLAQELAHPFSLGMTLSYTSYLDWHCQEENLAQEHATEAMTLATEHGLAEVFAWATMVQGWTKVCKREDGVSQIRQGLTTCRRIGVELALPQRLAMLAEAHGKMGQTEEGLNVLAEALTQVDKTGERNYEAELWRLRGELLLQQAGKLSH